MDDRHGIAQLHHVIHEDFDVVSANHLKLDLAEERHVRRAQRGIAQLKFHFALADDGRLIGADETDGLLERADAGRPTVEDTDATGHDGQLRQANDIDDADEKEVAVHFLANFLAHE